MIEDRKKLLENKEVIEEIKRHLWIESEKAGRDIGWDKAAEDWLNKYSEAWMKYHMPQAIEKKTRNRRTTVLKTRRASSYV